MFSGPDQSDAVKPCPTFGPPGPNAEGFFGDCNPATNFPGTRPIADYFNELIVNLRALLKKGGVAPNKGDETMLWRAIFGMTRIQTAVTLNVSAGGTPAPVNPFGGDPFDSLGSALSWLAQYVITSNGWVTIQIAAGTYTAPGPLVIDHPSGERVTISGAGTTSTTLHFTGQAGGITCNSHVGIIQNLTISGDATAAKPPQSQAYGLWLRAVDIELQNVTISGFAAGGMLSSSGVVWMPGGTTTLLANYGEGIRCGEFSVVGGEFATIIANNNGGVANLLCDSSYLTADTISTAGGTLGVFVTGKSVMTARKLGVDKCTNAAAVQCFNQAGLYAWAQSVAGDWWTWDVGGNHPQNFYAATMGLINAAVALASNNRTNCSPAINVVGNQQALIIAN